MNLFDCEPFPKALPLGELARKRLRGQARCKGTARCDRQTLCRRDTIAALIFDRQHPLSVTFGDTARLRLPAFASLPLASCWPLPQQLLLFPPLAAVVAVAPKGRGLGGGQLSSHTSHPAPGRRVEDEALDAVGHQQPLLLGEERHGHGLLEELALTGGQQRAAGAAGGCGAGRELGGVKGVAVAGQPAAGGENWASAV